MKSNNRRPVICRISATPFSVNKFLRLQIEYAIKEGYKVIVVTGYDRELDEFCKVNSIEYLVVDIERRFTPFKDAVSLYRILKVLSRYKIDCIHTITSKGGLLGVLAGKILRVPCIMHIYAGLPWCEMAGLKRKIGRLSDVLIGRWATMTYTDSDSEKAFILRERVCHANKLKVLGHGSVSGFDIVKYDRKSLAEKGRVELEKLGIPSSTKVILFVGRVTREKGVGELVEAFCNIADNYPDVVLLLVGPREDDIDPLNYDTKKLIDKCHRIFSLGYRSDPEVFYSIAELLVLPSYREGFGNVVIEAALCGIPALGTKIFGLSDSIVEDETGILVECKSVPALQNGLETLLINDSMRIKLGVQARMRGVECFSKDYVNGLLMNEYHSYIK